MKRQRPKSKQRRGIADRAARRGAAAVEFAILANIVLITVFTCMEFARLNMIRNLTQDAAYFAARHAIVPGATADEAITEADRIMSSLLSDGYTVDVGALNFESGEIAVTVSVDLDQVAFFTPMFLSNATIESTARMSTERYEGFYEQ